MPIVTPIVLSGGKIIDESYALLSIDIRREVNRIPYASLVFQDGNVAKRRFDLSNTALFEPGKEVEIKLRYESETAETTLFKGLVVRHGVEASVHGSQLRVEMKDAAIKLTQTRKGAVYVDQDDAAIIGKLVKDSGLKSGRIDATKPKLAQNVQYCCTDWDFIVSRAESQGLLVAIDDGEVSMREVELKAKPKHEFDYGISEIYDLEFELDAGSQYAKVQSSGWDNKELKLTAQTDAKDFQLDQGNLDGAGLAKAVGFEPCQLKYPAPLEADELQSWADGRMMRSRLSMIRGRLETAGIPDIKLFDVIGIDGIGTRFNGKTLVTGIRHSVDSDGWRTDLQFGLSARRFAREDTIMDVPAAGLLPGVNGLQIGIVDGFEEDPEMEFRLKVILPGIDGQTGSVWARLAAPDAGENHGWFFRPEIGDEVVVGFFNNDPRQPVVLGGMFGSKNKPPEDYSEITENNETRAIVTKTGSVIAFVDVDDKGTVFIETAEGARVLLDDNEKSLELSDQNGNEIRMNKDGITLKSAKDLKLEASGNVEIKGAKVDVK